MKLNKEELQEKTKMANQENKVLRVTNSSLYEQLKRNKEKRAGKVTKIKANCWKYFCREERTKREKTKYLLLSKNVKTVKFVTSEQAGSLA